MPIDPSLIDDSAADSANQFANDLGEYLDHTRKQEEAQEVVQNEEEQTEKQALSEQADPRNADKWGFKAFVKEGQSIFTGGAQDTASSLLTFPERTVDALTGEISKERKEKGYY